MPRFARLVVRFIAMGTTLLVARNGHAADADAEKAGLWRAVTRIRGSATLENRSWIHEPRETAESIETAQVRFVLVRDRGGEVALPPGLPPELAAMMRSAIAADGSKSAQVTWRAESAVITGAFRNENTVVDQGTTVGEANFTGEPVSLKDFTFVITPATGVWQIVTPGILREKYQVTYVTTGRDAGTTYDTRNSADSEVFDGTVTGKPAAISTTNHHEGQLDRKPTRGFTKTAKLRLWPEMEDAEVELTIDGYEKWRPEGSIAQPTSPGNHLVARATLVPKGATRVENLPAVTKFRFELLDTSREPGVCLNWPLNAKDEDYDLRLAGTPQFPAQLSDKDQTNELTLTLADEKGRPYAESQIDSFDFGGRTSLRVLCTLADGRELVGVMKDGGAGQDLVRVPKMAGADWIAESWRKEKDVEKLSASDDNEEVAGQQHKGDGFTLYEEYRGWVEKGKHLEGDPRKKDFFVLNLIDADARGGIALFARLSQLAVHSKLRDGQEMSQEDRLMNGNRRDAPQRVKQHGVVISHEAGGAGGYNVGVEGADKKKAGRPSSVKFVYVETHHENGLFAAAGSAKYYLNERDARSVYDRGVAHELFHTVGVDHHGDQVWELVRCNFQGASAPLNPTHHARFTTGISLSTSQIDKPEEFHEDRGATITLLWEDTRRDVAEDSIAAHEAKLDESRAHQRSELSKAEYVDITAKMAAMGIAKEPAFWAEYNADRFASIDEYRGIRVGAVGGTDCGNELCVMRYYFANAYKIAGRENAYYLIRPVPGATRAGRDICRSPTGTGTNAASHSPQSRFGDAHSGRGNCFGDICPNDAIPPRSIALK